MHIFAVYMGNDGPDEDNTDQYGDRIEHIIQEDRHIFDALASSSND
jgi:hypothetical protein